MSIPRNHHHVSQCHIRLFFNEQEKKIYCYDKQLDHFYSKTTSKSLFSEADANSRPLGNAIDHESLEMDLKINFEDDFDRHARNILALANKPYAPYDSQLESLYYLACHGLIADIRNPVKKKETDDVMDGGFLELAERIRTAGNESYARSIEKSISERKKTKYSNPVYYSRIAAKRLEVMGDLDFVIFKINSMDSFILPDAGCIQFRSKINNYFNPNIREVALIGIPLTDKVFVSACSKKLGSTDTGVKTINDDKSPIVAEINRDLFLFAHKTIAAKDEQQLKRVVSQLKSI